MSDKTDAAKIIVAGQIAVCVANKLPRTVEKPEELIQKCVEYFYLAFKALDESSKTGKVGNVEIVDNPFYK